MVGSTALVRPAGSPKTCASKVDTRLPTAPCYRVPDSPPMTGIVANFHRRDGPAGVLRLAGARTRRRCRSAAVRHRGLALVDAVKALTTPGRRSCSRLRVGHRQPDRWWSAICTARGRRKENIPPVGEEPRTWRRGLQRPWPAAIASESCRSRPVALLGARFQRRALGARSCWKVVGYRPRPFRDRRRSVQCASRFDAHAGPALTAPSSGRGQR